MKNLHPFFVVPLPIKWVILLYNSLFIITLKCLLLRCILIFDCQHFTAQIVCNFFDKRSPKWKSWRRGLFRLLKITLNSLFYRHSLIQGNSKFGLLHSFVELHRTWNAFQKLHYNTSYDTMGLVWLKNKKNICLQYATETHKCMHRTKVVNV